MTETELNKKWATIYKIISYNTFDKSLARYRTSLPATNGLLVCLCVESVACSVIFSSARARSLVSSYIAPWLSLQVKAEQ